MAGYLPLHPQCACVHSLHRSPGLQERVFLRTPEGVRESLGELLAEMEVGYNGSWREGDRTLRLNCRGYPVILEGNRGTHYCVVSLHTMLLGHRIRRSLNELYDRRN